jgi:hypothetical protein
MAGQFSAYNTVDQLLDVAGSERQANDRRLTDETGGFGSPVILASGSAATITAFASPNLSVGGLTGMLAQYTGALLSLRIAGISGNNGVFTVNAFTDANDVVVTNAAGYFPDPNSGALEWELYNAGATGSITAVVGGIATFTTGLQTTFTQNSVGHFITISGANTPANNGTFLITAFLSTSSIQYANANAIFPDTHSGTLLWIENLPYSLNDDLDFERSDRSYIKGVNFDQPVPTYVRPTLIGVPVPTNLANIAGKTLDAEARCVNRGQFNWPVEQTLTDIYGSLKHADNVNQTGVPVFDTGPFTSDWESCYVEVTNFLDGVEIYVLAGPQAGQKIYGQTYNGASTSPTSVEIRWYSAPPGANIGTAGMAYTWEIGPATGTNAGTTAVTITPTSNGAATLAGLTGGTFTNADVGNWINLSGFTHPSNNGNFVIISVQSNVAITIQDHAAILETQVVGWAEYAQSQKTFVDLTYGYNERLDQLDQNAFRFPFVSGLVADSSLRQSINDILSTGGWVDGTTNLSTYLTNTGNYYVFSTLPGGAGDTVVAALNALNMQIGNRTYTGTILTSGQTITQSLQALANAVTSTTVLRTIERLSATIPANTPHTLPGGLTYVIDPTDNAKYLWIFWRGILRDPGTVANGDEYQETSTTSFTPYSKINATDHITYITV